MDELEAILKAVEDGGWHDLNELSTLEGLRKWSVTGLRLFLTPLITGGFIEIRDAWKGEPPILTTEVKMQDSTRMFLREVRLVEKQRERY